MHKSAYAPLTHQSALLASSTIPFLSQTSLSLLPYLPSSFLFSLLTFFVPQPSRLFLSLRPPHSALLTTPRPFSCRLQFCSSWVRRCPSQSSTRSVQNHILPRRICAISAFFSLGCVITRVCHMCGGRCVSQKIRVKGKKLSAIDSPFCDVIPLSPCWHCRYLLYLFVGKQTKRRPSQPHHYPDSFLFRQAGSLTSSVFFALFLPEYLLRGRFFALLWCLCHARLAH